MAARSTQALRARDIDRGLVATALDTAYADGQLTFDEHRSRVESARAAKTLGELHALAADLQADVPIPEVPRPAPRTRRHAMVVGAGVVLVVIALAVVLAVRTVGDSGPTAQTPTATARPIAAADGTVVPIVARPFDFATEEGLTDFRDRYLARFVDPIVTDLTFYPPDDRAALDRVVDGNRTRSVTVSGGFDEAGDSDVIASGYFPLDLTQIDFARMAGLMAGAATFVEVPDATVTHVIARNMGTPEVLIFASNADNQGGYLETTLAGDVVRTAPYRP